MVQQSRSQFRLAAVLAAVSLALLAIAVLYEPPTPARPAAVELPLQPDWVAAPAEVRAEVPVDFDEPLVTVARGEAVALDEQGAARSLTVQVLSWPDHAALPDAELLVEPAPEGGSLWLPVQRDGRVWLTWSEAPGQVEVLARAPGFAESARSFLVALDAAEQQIVLRPTAGYVGRVVTTLGDPVGRAKVKVWRSWPARPAFVSPTGAADRSPELAVIPERSKLLADVYTDANGYYRLKAFDMRNVVDLVVAVVGSRDGTVPLRVPMPHPGRELPLVVVRPVRPLTGQLLDERGNPLAGVAVQLDRAPGTRRGAAAEALTDEQGRFTFERHLGRQHLRVQAPWHEVLGAFEGELELPLVPSEEPRRSPVETAGVPFVPLPPWVVVESDIGAVRVQLAGKGHVRGVVTAARDGMAMDGAVVTIHAADQVGWETVALARSDRSGRFHALVPTAHLHRALRLTVSAPHYLSVEIDVAALANPFDAPYQLRLSPASRQDILRVDFSDRDRLRSRASPVDIYAWNAVGTTSLFDHDGIFQVPLDRPPFWVAHGRASPWGFVVPPLPLPPENQSQVVLLVRERREDKVNRVIAWEVSTSDKNWSDDRALLTLAPTVPLRVQVSHFGSGPSLHLRRTTWLPWFDVEETYDKRLPRLGNGGEHITELKLSEPSWTRVELVELREPVDLVHDESGEFEVSAEESLELIQLVRPADHLVTGSVAFRGAGDWPDMAVALCGPATESHRREALGQTSWWERASLGHGEFRFEAVPEGVYAFLLYRPFDERQVEVLAQRTVTVNHDLFQLDIWPDPKTSPLRQLVRAN